MQYKAIKHASDDIVKILSGGGVSVASNKSRYVPKDQTRT